MKRREFMEKTGCGFAGMFAAGTGLESLLKDSGAVQQRRRYKIEIEIYEAKDSICRHKEGQKFNYPEDLGKICPWFIDSMWTVIRLLQAGVTLPWTYKGTPYEKVIDPDGITTEYIRCGDPTSHGLVAKIIRTAV